MHLIFLKYQNSLKNFGQIDFDDMINLATESIKQGQGEFNYKYIIIDEYQDIDISRFNLVKEIKNRTLVLCIYHKNQEYYLSTYSRQSTIYYVNELIQKFNVGYVFDSINGEKSIKANPTCQKYQSDHLIKENSKTKEKFLGCEHFPNCEYTLKDIKIINNQIKCRVCGGYMTKRKGRYGDFYGCTNYPYCNNKLQVIKY